MTLARQDESAEAGDDSDTLRDAFRWCSVQQVSVSMHSNPPLFLSAITHDKFNLSSQYEFYMEQSCKQKL